MKILFQTYDTFRQNRAGGVNTRVTAFCEHLRRRGVEVGLFDKWTTRIDDYDMVHFFKADPAFLPMAEYAAKAGKKIVVSSIVPLEHGMRICMNLALEKVLPVHTPYGLTRSLLNIADAVMTESETESLFISRNYGVDADKFHALPNGVCDGVLGGDPALIRKELPFEGDFVLQVGRIDANKNLHNTIKALRDTGIPLVAIGGCDSGSDSYYKKCIETADRNVHFLGWMDHSDPRLASAYAAAKVLVMPSFRETYGIVLAEGAANGCTPACSEGLQIGREWMRREDVVMFDPGNPASMREALVRAFRSPRDVSAKDYYRTLFSWDNIVEKQYRIYEALLQNK